MAAIAAVLACWQLDMRQVRERMYRSPTPRERDAQIIGAWLAALDRAGPAALDPNALAEAATAPPESHQDALHGDPIGASVKLNHEDTKEDEGEQTENHLPTFFMLFVSSWLIRAAWRILRIVWGVYYPLARMERNPLW